MARRKHGRIRVGRITTLVIYLPKGRNDPPPKPRQLPYVPPKAEFKKRLPEVQPAELTPPRLLPLPPRNTQPNPCFSCPAEPMARGVKSLLRKERYEGGHKGKKARRLRKKFGFSMGWGRGAHDPKYKDVRRGHARAA